MAVGVRVLSVSIRVISMPRIAASSTQWFYEQAPPKTMVLPFTDLGKANSSAIDAVLDQRGSLTSTGLAR
jgi:hypothetical protein